MKKMFRLPLTLILTLISFCGLAQTTGDYRTNAAAFNWSTDASWQRWDGGAWVVPTAAQGYPGETAASIAGTVTIRTGHNVTANTDVTTFDIGNLILQGSGIITMSANTDIDATGTLTMDGTSQIAGGSNSRTLDVTAMSIPASATNARIAVILLTITGNATVTGTLAMNGPTVPISGNLTVNGAGVLSMGSNANVDVVGTLTLDGTSQITGGGTDRTLDAAVLSIPATATNARITNIKLTITDTNLASLPIAASILGTLNMSSTTSTITGDTTVGATGILTLSSDTGIKKFNGTVNVLGSWTSTALVTTGRLVFGGEVLTSGTFNPGCQDQ